ncbi:hypothetical protein CCR95_07030 [Thiocystis minor]|nr:hypothetical protein [Thiocystis minor]
MHRLRLLDAHRQPVIGHLPPDADVLERPLRVEDALVGVLQLGIRPGLTDALDLEFQRRQTRMIGMSALLGLAIALLAAVPLARHLVGPLRTLTGGLRTLTGGHYSVRVNIRRGDELNELANGFNQLAQTLEHNEALRRHWIADVSHELRTPLAVLSGELDALAEGVRPVSARAIGSLQSEVGNLSKLVDDLYQLALSDLGALSYRKEPLELEPLLAMALERGAPGFARAGLRLDSDLQQPPNSILGDAARLTQLIDNLLENSRRYTHAGGQVRLRTQRQGAWVRLVLSDSAPGVADDALPRLFERLFREERSRSRAHGGAGLGLAICTNIVTAHGGRIQAAHSPLGGLEIAVTLPVLESS